MDGKIFPAVIIEARVSRLLPGQIGLFAVRNLKSGTVIFRAMACEETFFDKDVYNGLDEITKKSVTTYCAMVYDGFYSVPDLNYMPLQSFCNHNCEPNVGFNKNGDTILIKDVCKDEELFIDFGFMTTDPQFKMKCLCGSESCRGIVTGNDWKNKDYYQKNIDHMNV